MTITNEIREQVRHRANFACEFCGVTEIDAGGELAIDHFRPIAKGGDDSFENLVYCCHRCNQHKLDYWSTHLDEPSLWNPRREPAPQHFLELDDGTLHALTAVGTFTLKRLRLNRPPLVAYRLRKRQQAEEIRLLTRYREMVQLLEQLNAQLSVLMEEQRQLLEEQRELLRLLLSERE
ncbi:MAG: HNH endonuclease [Chloroflexi bacterium]|nr:HNH endonuclease [Chloroflexota bacterium]